MPKPTQTQQPKPTFTPTLAASGFAIPITKNCPVTRKSHGIIQMPPNLIAALSTAVMDKLEWAVILYGKSEQDGFLITVDSLLVPPDQTRTSGNVDLPETDLTPDCVGVLHSHHTMGAFFSGTDNQHFNDKFPTSTVIAVPKSTNNTAGPIAHILGFDYKAEGRVKLPCGALAMVGFRVVPIPSKVRDWPEAKEKCQPFIGRDEKDDKLGDCRNSTHQSTRGRITIKEVSKCGIEKLHIPNDAFGENMLILNRLPVVQKVEPIVRVYGGEFSYVDADGYYKSYGSAPPHKDYRPQTTAEAAAERLALVKQNNLLGNSIVNGQPIWGWDNYIFKILADGPKQSSIVRHPMRPEHLTQAPTDLIQRIIKTFRITQFKSPEDIAAVTTPVQGWALFQSIFRDVLYEYMDDLKVSIHDKIAALKCALHKDKENDQIMDEEEIMELMVGFRLEDLFKLVFGNNQPKLLKEGQDYVEVVESMGNLSTGDLVC